MKEKEGRALDSRINEREEQGKNTVIQYVVPDKRRVHTRTVLRDDGIEGDRKSHSPTLHQETKEEEEEEKGLYLNKN